MRDSIFRKLFMILIVVMAFFDVKLQAAVEERHMNQYVERCLDRTAAVFSMEENTGNEASKNENGEGRQASRREESGRNDNAGDPQASASENQAGAVDSESESATMAIRVLLTGGQGYTHHDFTLSFEEDYYIQNGQEVYYGEAGTSINEADIASLFARQSERNDHTGNVQSNGQSFGEEDGLIVGIWRNGGWDTDAEWKLSMDGGVGETYQGILVISEADGGYYLVNTLPLESYLYYVLPSEMPSNYPMEALKAQAVCARSYAMLQIRQGRMEQYGADVDDTTAFQVYHAQGTSEAARQAVDETAGQYLSYQGEPIEAFYYACSCGHSTTADIWRGSAGRDYSYLVYQDYGALEQESPWYRWSYHAKQFDIETLKSRLLAVLAQNKNYISIYSGEGSSKEGWTEITDRGKMEAVISGMSAVQDIQVQERLAGEVVDCLHIVSGSYHIMIEGEYHIRNVLTADGYMLIKQDMSVSEGLTLVPSGFFEIETVKQDGNLIAYVLKGGGFGHGVGMSQYGARYLAEEGKDYEYILTYYYENVTMEMIY
ncbi:MAG: SpoIID/LytB domain-containing protein [Lachnospiraceae bacterium]|nr:SpoIID/LytB domain-containing protein [Lachnospiraceae bacterium]